MTRKVLLLLIIAFSATETFAANLGFLDVKCRMDNASPAQQYDAAKMYYGVNEKLKQLMSEQRKNGKELKVVIVARAGLDSKNTVLLKDEVNGKPYSVEEMMQDLDSRAKELRRRSPNAKTSAIKDDILEKDYIEPKDSARNLIYTHVGFYIHSAADAIKEITEGQEEVAKINAELVAAGREPIEYTYDPDLVGWRYVHLLSPCNKNMSRIYKEGGATFFLDNPNEYRAMIMVPTDTIQERIVEIINNTTHYQPGSGEMQDNIQWSLKPPTYNLVASLDNVEEANSNTWPLYVLALAIRGVDKGNYHDANKMLKELGFRPSKVRLGGMYKFLIRPWLVGRMFIPKAVKFRKEDHPAGKPYNVVEINTAISLKEFLERNDALQTVVEAFPTQGPVQPTEIEIEVGTEDNVN